MSDFEVKDDMNCLLDVSREGSDFYFFVDEGGGSFAQAKLNWHEVIVDKGTTEHLF